LIKFGSIGVLENAQNVGHLPIDSSVATEVLNGQAVIADLQSGTIKRPAVGTAEEIGLVYTQNPDVKSPKKSGDLVRVFLLRNIVNYTVVLDVEAVTSVGTLVKGDYLIYSATGMWAKSAAVPTTVKYYLQVTNPVILNNTAAVECLILSN
jgi:hypothetical protein